MKFVTVTQLHSAVSARKTYSTNKFHHRKKASPPSIQTPASPFPPFHGALISPNKSKWLVLTSIYTSMGHSTHLKRGHLILRSPEVCDCRFSKEKTRGPKGLSSSRKSKAHEVTGDFVIGGHHHVYSWTPRKQLLSAFQRTVDTHTRQQRLKASWRFC